MFCGGIFAFNSEQNDLFVVADGVEMSQKELLNICRGAMSLLYSKPLENGGRRVLFVEAASTLLVKQGGYTFGVSTYHQQSIPVLCSVMARVLSLLKNCFDNDIQPSNNHFRSQMFHAFRQLLGNNQGVIPPHSATKAMNVVEDVNLNKPGSFHMDPVLSGEFTNGEVNVESTTSTDITSTLDSYVTGALSSTNHVASEMFSNPEMGTVDVALNEEITFNAVGGQMTESEVDIRITACAKCSSDMGGVFMNLPQQPSSVSILANPQVMQEEGEYYVCANPTTLLKEDTPVLAVRGKDPTKRELPLTVKTTIQQSETHAKITFNITSPHEINSFIIGVEGQGMDPSRVASQNSEVAAGSGGNFFIRPTATIPSGGGSIEASFFGPLISSFVRPTSVNIQCKIPNLVFADVNPKMKPGSNFIVGNIKRYTFIQRSLWPITE